MIYISAGFLGIWETEITFMCVDIAVTSWQQRLQTKAHESASIVARNSSHCILAFPKYLMTNSTISYNLHYRILSR